MKRLVLAALLALLAGCAAPAAERRMVDPSGRIYADPEPGVPGIHRFAWLDDHVARGAQPNEVGLRWLAARGFRTIIAFNDPGRSERDLARSLGMRFVSLPVRADLRGSSPPTSAQLDTFFSVTKDPTQGPVFIHCKHGADRTGMFAALYRLEVNRWTRAEAIGEMDAFGYNGFFKDLKRTVETYEPTPAPTATGR